MAHLENTQFDSRHVEFDSEITAIFRDGKKQVGFGLDGLTLCSLVVQGITELSSDDGTKPSGHG